MFLRNHGLVAVGRSVEEAFTRAYHTVLACEAQITMMSAGIENLIIVSEEAKQRSMVRRFVLRVPVSLPVCVYSSHICFFVVCFSLAAPHITQEVVRRAQQMIEDGALKEKPGQEREVDKTAKAPQVRWNIGDLEFEAYMRMMDSAVSCLLTAFGLLRPLVIYTSCCFLLLGLSNGIPVPTTLREETDDHGLMLSSRRIRLRRRHGCDTVTSHGEKKRSARRSCFH